MKYLVKHWLNVDMIAEEVIDEKELILKQTIWVNMKHHLQNAKYIVNGDF